ncbi:hypothetical protein E8E11_003972 [Didymella keratinophila]|nr:hypothetical protein E8E11_003972 [Didymella keratinophila]
MGFPLCPLRQKVSHYILRIPHWGNEHMQRHIATLEFVSTQLHVSVPITVLYDFSSDIVFGVPYTLQIRLPGENLQSAFTQLNLKQRKGLTHKICEGVLRMHESSYGDCFSVSTYDVTSSKLELRSLAIPLDPDNDGKVNSLPAHGTSDTHTFIKTTCQRWKDYESTFLRKPRAEWDRCMEMAQEMTDCGYLNVSERLHFTHMDLYPRNILINLTDDTSVEITGILDWDDALFAPKYMACEEEVDETDEYEGLKVPQTSDLQEVKALFESLFEQEFLKYAYREEYILLRHIFVILQMGLGYSHFYTELDAILDRWKELKRSTILEVVAREVCFVQEQTVS